MSQTSAGQAVPGQGILHVDILRHGSLATAGLFCAPPDEPLNHQGWQTLQKATAHLPKQYYQGIYSSPFTRCQRFAANLAAHQACPLRLEPAFREMDFGSWTGLSSQALWQQHPKALQQLWQQPESFQAPDGESMQHFQQRVLDGWQNLLQTYSENPSQQDTRLLLVTHAGVTRILLAYFLQIPYANTLKFELYYAHFTCLRIFPDQHLSLSGINLPLPANDS